MTKQADGKKAVITVAAVLSLSPVLFSSADRTIRQGSVELALGSYIMNEPRFEAAYPTGGPIGGLTLSSALISHINIYLDIKYYSRRGALTFSREKTVFYMVPIDVGVRYIYPLGFIHPYLGGGLDFYLYYEDNPIGTVLNYTNGYHVTGGAYLRFSRSVPVMVNLRLKYTSAKAKQDFVETQLGGFEYGLGLAFVF